MAAEGGIRAAERGFAQQQEMREAVKGTDMQAIEEMHARFVKTFRTGKTRTYEWRVAQLEGMNAFMKDHKTALSDALGADLGRPKMEALLGDIAATIAEIDHALAHLKAWMTPESVSTPLLQQPGRSAIVREPKGVVLAIAPWNFPVHLAVASLSTAVMAGNCCILKPSEVAPATEALLRDVLPRYVDPEAIGVVTGGVAETTALLKLRWDHIMYTGNSMVARVVSRAAAEHLTPVTLELGGKSPTIILPGTKIHQAVRRILAGKLMNSGQICIAPDYVLVHESCEAELVKELKGALQQFYGDDAAKSDSFGRIINKNHFNRVRTLVESSDGEVYQHGTMDEASKFMPPTIIRNASPSSAVMQEEIFGPILPMMKVGSIDQIVDHINANEKPLAMYIFGTEADAEKVISRTSSGGVCVNDTLMHFANPNLPFGGVGNSGTGRYHGKFGFDELSHLRAVMYRSTFIDAPQRYPPYQDHNLMIMEKLMVGPILPPALKKALMAAGAAAAGVAVLRSKM